MHGVSRASTTEPTSLEVILCKQQKLTEATFKKNLIQDTLGIESNLENQALERAKNILRPMLWG